MLLGCGGQAVGGEGNGAGEVSRTFRGSHSEAKTSDRKSGEVKKVSLGWGDA